MARVFGNNGQIIGGKSSSGGRINWSKLDSYETRETVKRKAPEPIKISSKQSADIIGRAAGIDPGLKDRKITTMPKASLLETLIGIPQAVASPVVNMAFGNATKLLNTSIAANKAVYGDLPRVIAGKVTGNKKAADQAAFDLQRNFNQNLAPGSGIMGAGTFFEPNDPALRGDAGRLAAKTLGAGVGVATEIAPFTRAGQVISEVAQGGKSLGGAVVRNAAENAVYGAAGSTANQLVDTGRIDTGQVAKEAGLAAALGGAIPVVGKAVSKATGKVGIKEVPTKSLVSYEGVPDKSRVKVIKQQIQAGERPVVKTAVDSTGAIGIEDGKHTYQAYKELGFKKVPTEDVTDQIAARKPQTPQTLTEALPETGYKPVTTKKNESVRSNQYTESLQDEIRKIETSPEYKAALQGKGGDRVVSNLESHQRALEAGALDPKVIKSAKVGQPVDTVTLIRAKATLDSTASDFADAFRSGDATKIKQFGDELAKLEAGYKVMSAEPGRATQIQSTFAAKNLKVAQEIHEMTKSTNGTLTKKQTEYINKKIAELQKEAASSGKFKEIAQRMVDGVEEYSTAAKLTSPMTHLINMGSNILTFGQRAIETAASVGIRAAKRETGVGELKSVFGSSTAYRAATQRLAEGLEDIIKLRPLRSEAQFADKIKPVIGGRVGEVVRVPFKFLSIADDFSKGILRDSDLTARAYQQAYQEGFRKTDLTKRIGEIIQNPPKSMVEAIEKTAKEFTFQSDPGKAVKAITGVINNIPGGRLIVPFIQTPTNIVKFQANRSLLGAVSPRNWNDLIKGGSREQADAAARLLTGTLFSVGAYSAVSQLADENRITGAAPTDPSARDLFYSQGKKPYSIKVGDKWISYQRFQPVGMYLLQAASLQEALKGKKSGEGAGDMFGAFVATAAKGLADLPFVSGVSGLIEAINEPDRSGSRMISRLLTGSIPNISRDIANYRDDIERYPKTVQDQIYAMIPGLSKKVQPRVDILGESQKKDPNAAIRGFVKIVKTENKNKLLDSLQQLRDETGYSPSQLRRSDYKDLPDAKFTELQKSYGQKFATKLEKALNDSRFQNRSPIEKQKDLEGMAADAKAKAKEDLLGKKEKTKSIKKLKF